MDLIQTSQFIINKLYHQTSMIDIIIITAYIAVALKIMLKVFEWIQNRFTIFGRIEVRNESAQNNKATLDTDTEIKTENGVNKLQGTEQEKVEGKQPVEEKEILPKEAQVKPTVEHLQIHEEIPQITDSQPIQPEAQPVNSQVSIPQQPIPSIIQTSPLQQSVQQILKTPLIEINLPSQDQYTDETLLQQNQELRQLCEQIKKERLDEREELLGLLEKLKDEKNKIGEKLVKVGKECDGERMERERLLRQVDEVSVGCQRQLEEMKARYEAQVQQLKQQLLKQQQLLQKAESSTIVAQSNTTTSQQPSHLQSRIDQLRYELQFCQSQLQQANQSESKLKQEIERLKTSTGSRMKSRSSISISDVINHPEYLRIKEKLQKYQSGTMSSGMRSVMRTQLTPQGDRMSKGLDSRISQRRSFISSRLGGESVTGEKQQPSQQVFAECSFLSQQNKHFLLDEIKKIKKLPIKKTKLIFKLDKLHPTNPHQNIDNIPNIVLLVQLTNKKILAAFTQTAFSKEDAVSSIGEKSMVGRSRYGSNKSLIVDLTNKVSFLNNRNSETIVYDENAIVWGKDQLVVKNDQPTILYSSFGAEDSVYWDGKYSLEELLGGSQGFERISQYQFYRIYIG